MAAYGVMPYAQSFLYRMRQYECTSKSLAWSTHNALIYSDYTLTNDRCPHLSRSIIAHWICSFEPNGLCIKHTSAKTGLVYSLSPLKLAPHPIFWYGLFPADMCDNRSLVYDAFWWWMSECWSVLWHSLANVIVPAWGTWSCDISRFQASSIPDYLMLTTR